MFFMNKIQNLWGETSQIKTSTMKENNKLEKAIAVIAALCFWHLAALLINNPLFLVTPLTVIDNLIKLCVTSSFWHAIAFSFLKIEAGFFLALITGIILSIVAAHFRLIEIMLFPYIAVIKSTPVASFIILCLIWLSSSNLSVFISFLMVLPIIYTNVLQGIKSTDKKLIEMATLFKVTLWRKINYIYIPQLKPYIISACSISIGLSWKAGIAAEVIGIPQGSIGEKLYQAKVYLSSGDLFSWTLVIVLISIIFEKSFLFFLKSFLDRK